MWTTEPNANDLTCPFCGLACDDLSMDAAPAVPVPVNACALAQGSFTTVLAQGPQAPTIDGRPAGLDAAVERAATLLMASHAPLFGGLVCDVNGMRACLELAERCGAILDHVGGDGLFRNLLVMQDGGWMATTLTEVRNRADLVLVVGTAPLTRYPRLLERVLAPAEALFSPPERRTLVLLGPWDRSRLPAAVRSLDPLVIPVAPRDLPGVSALLRALAAVRRVRTGALGKDLGRQLADLAGRLREARYAVVTWSAAEMTFPHAELTIQTLAELVRDLNRFTRAAVLPLAGSLGDVTANQVCTWQTGYPLRSGRQHGRRCYEPVLYRCRDLLARDACDLLLWVQSLPSARPVPPPVSRRPTIVLGYPWLPLARTPEVMIPVGLPGIDHPGHWFRSDAVCPLPLGRIRDRGLPAVAEILRRIGDAMGRNN